jgi:plastocyanin
VIPPNTVIAEGSADAFDPNSLTVSVGTIVTFTFEATGHNVTFDLVGGRPADIPGTNTNTSIQRQFNAAGTFTYQCTIHPGMAGTIIVTQ